MSGKKQKYVVRFVQDETGVSEEIVEVTDHRVCDGCRLQSENAWKTCDLVGIDVVSKYLLQRIPDYPEGFAPCAFVRVKFLDEDWETIKKEVQEEVGTSPEVMTNGAWFKVVLLRNVRTQGDAAFDFEMLSEEEAIAQARELQTTSFEKEHRQTVH